MRYLHLLWLLLAACSGTEIGTKSLASITPGCDAVTDHGAVAGDGLDDAPAFQAAIDACAAIGGGDVTVPAGLYTMARYGGWAYFTVGLADGVTLRGSRAGSVLQLAPNSAASVRMFYTDGAVDAAITDLTLDGNKAAQAANEHRHGVMANGSTRLRLERLNVRNFTGDGVYLFHDANDTTVRDLDIRDNDRNGLTMAGALHGVLIADSRIENNAAQQLDTEPGTPHVVSDVTVRGCTLGGGNSFAVVIGGNGSATHGHGWTVQGNHINGAVYVVWASRVTLTGNVIRNPSVQPAIDVYRSTSQILISDNVVDELWTGSDGTYGIRAISTGVGNQPDDVVISGNSIRVANPVSFGIDLRGILRATVTGNTLIGAGASTSTYGAIRVRATTAVRSAVITNNTMRNFSYGVLVVSPELISYLYTAGNVLDTGTVVGATP